MRTELLSSCATWLRGYLAFLSCYALQTELLGSVAAWPFLLPSLGKARVVLMQIYGELERIVRLPERPGSLINSDPSMMVLTLRTFFLFLGVIGIRT